MNFKLTYRQISLAFITIMVSAACGIAVGMILLYLGYVQIGLIAAMISITIGWITLFTVLASTHWGWD